MHESDTLNEIKVAVEEPQSWARRLTITVPATRVERERREVARNLARRVRLPGFRKGKVPPSVIEKRFAAVIDQETVERAVGNAYREALEQHQFQPITEGSVDDVDYSPGSDLTFKVDFEVQPTIELTRIGGFKLEREQPEVAEDAVNEILERLRRDHAQWRTLDEDATPQAEDMVHIEITPVGDDDASAEPRAYRIVLGQGHAVPDIEDAIRTLRTGQDGEFGVRLADEAEGAEGEGPTQQRVRIKLLEAQRPELPDVDDELARSVGDFDDLEALRSAIRTDLEREAESEAERKVRQELIEMIVDANPFDVPQSMIDNYVKRLFSTAGEADEARVAQIREVAAPAAERVLKRMLVIEEVAESHELRATPEEVDQRVEAIAEQQGRSPAEVWAQLQKSGRLAALEEEITEEKVFEFLLAQSTVE